MGENSPSVQYGKRAILTLLIFVLGAAISLGAPALSLRSADLRA
jgi:hypothetical protein